MVGLAGVLLAVALVLLVVLVLVALARSLNLLLAQVDGTAPVVPQYPPYLSVTPDGAVPRASAQAQRMV